MKQPIAGVTPADTAEATVTTVWPSIAAYPSGQALGRLCEIRWPGIYLFQLGNLFALLGIPMALVLYFCRIAPGTAVRYVVTNRRITVQRGFKWKEARSIAFHAFDEIDIDVLSGQAWYPAGDLVMRQSGKEVFRLAGVSWPEGLRQTILKSRTAYLSVQQARQQRPACA
jgi:hypothetical protein